MNLDERNQENKALSGFKGSMDLFMGALYVAVALYIWKYPIGLEQFKGFPVTAFSILFGAYGAFRIYRGWTAIRSMITRKGR